MVIVMKKESTNSDIARVQSFVQTRQAKTHLSIGAEHTVIGVIGYQHNVKREHLLTLSSVEKVIPISKPYKLVSREFKQEDTLIRVGNVLIGGETPVIMAGPCSVENEQQIIEIAKSIRQRGANILRGGAFKPRSNPYSFQGLGEVGLKLLKKAREESGLPIVTEVLQAAHVDLVSEYADILQIGARNMQNYELLKEVGRTRKPVLLKRGMSAQMKEFLMSAEYIISEGNSQVILCERGIRTFVEYSRNTLDLNIVPAIKKISHLPIIVDPSHGTGRRDLVIPLSMAALAVGADGLMVEVHTHPDEAFSDAAQTLTPDEFSSLVHQAQYFVQAKRNIQRKELVA